MSNLPNELYRTLSISNSSAFQDVRQHGLGKLARLPDELLIDIFEEAICGDREKNQEVMERCAEPFQYPRDDRRLRDDKARVNLLLVSRSIQSLTYQTPSQKSFAAKIQLGSIFGDTGPSSAVKASCLQMTAPQSMREKVFSSTLPGFEKRRDSKHRIVAHERLKKLLPAVQRLDLNWDNSPSSIERQATRRIAGGLNLCNLSDGQLFGRQLQLSANLYSLDLNIKFSTASEVKPERNSTEKLLSERQHEQLRNAKGLGNALAKLPKLRELRWMSKDLPPDVYLHIETIAIAMTNRELRLLEFHYDVEDGNLPVLPRIYLNWHVPEFPPLVHLEHLWWRQFPMLDRQQPEDFTGFPFPQEALNAQVAKLVKSATSLKNLRVQLPEP